MSLIEQLTAHLQGGTLQKMAEQVGGDEKQTQAAVAAALPTLLGALARNASKGDGAQKLHQAVAKDHDGSVLDNLGAFIGNAQSGPGDGILRHVLGARRPAVEAGLSQTSGLDRSSVSKLLATLAPVVMGALGREQREKQLDAHSLAGMLGQERKRVEEGAPQEMSMLSRLLDSDGDGDVDVDDLAKKGMGMLGKLFGRR